MSRLHISLFGKVEVRYGNQVLQDWGTQKAKELFCYLLLHRKRPHRREMLAGLLWDHCTTAQSKAYLRKVLWQLQHLLKVRDAQAPNRLLLVTAEWVQVNPAADYGLDVACFEQAFERAKQTEPLEPKAAAAVQEAVRCYTGDLLENWYQDWCLYERERCQHLYLVMLDKLMDYCEAQQAYEQALAYGEKVLHIDRAREHTHRRLMRLLYRSGDRTSALRQYERCTQALAEELGVKPSRRTEQLYQNLCADRLELEASSARQNGSSPPSLFERLAYIKTLQERLTAVQVQIQRELEAVEWALQHRE